MDKPATFPYFSRLPAELRLGIWEAAALSPSIHLFDVCLPPDALADPELQHEASSRSGAAFGNSLADEDRKRFAEYRDTVFLDLYCRGTSGDRDRDPSMYKWKMALEMACVDAAAAAATVVPSSVRSRAVLDRRSRKTTPEFIYTDAVNSVLLPGPCRIIHYNNQTDILHLCFPALRPAETTTSQQRSPVAQRVHLLDVQWSSAMAETLRAARRVAFDAAQAPSLVEMDGPMASEEELMLLACTLQMNLDVLYLVVDGTAAGKPQATDASALQRRGQLVQELDVQCGVDDAGRQPDVIQGVGRTYREVFGLEQLGWSDSKPAYRFGLGLGKAIRTLQQDGTGAVRFQGVRVLVSDDE